MSNEARIADICNSLKLPIWDMGFDKTAFQTLLQTQLSAYEGDPNVHINKETEKKKLFLKNLLDALEIQMVEDLKWFSSDARRTAAIQRYADGYAEILTFMHAGFRIELSQLQSEGITIAVYSAYADVEKFAAPSLVAQAAAAGQDILDSRALETKMTECIDHLKKGTLTKQFLEETWVQYDPIERKKEGSYKDHSESDRKKHFLNDLLNNDRYKSVWGNAELNNAIESSHFTKYFLAKLHGVFNPDGIDQFNPIVDMYAAECKIFSAFMPNSTDHNYWVNSIVPEFAIAEFDNDSIPILDAIKISAHEDTHGVKWDSLHAHCAGHERVMSVKDKEQNTLFHIAVNEEKWSIALQIIKTYSAEMLMQQDSHGHRPLYYAVIHDQVEIIKEILFKIKDDSAQLEIALNESTGVNQLSLREVIAQKHNDILDELKPAKEINVDVVDISSSSSSSSDAATASSSSAAGNVSRTTFDNFLHGAAYCAGGLLVIAGALVVVASYLASFETAGLSLSGVFWGDAMIGAGLVILGAQACYFNNSKKLYVPYYGGLTPTEIGEGVSSAFTTKPALK